MTELNQHPRQRPATRQPEGLYGAEALSALPIEDQIRQLCTALPAETGWHIITEYSGGVLRLGQIRVCAEGGSYELTLRTVFCDHAQKDTPHFPDDEGAEYSLTLIADELLYTDVVGSGDPLWSEKIQDRAQATLTIIGTVYEAHRRTIESVDRAAGTMGRVVQLYPSGVESRQDSLMYIAGNKIADAISLCTAIQERITKERPTATAVCADMETWLNLRAQKPVVSLAEIQAKLSRLLRACADAGIVPDEYFHLKTLLKSPEPDQATTQVD